jgi:hypothetical protein
MWTAATMLDIGHIQIEVFNSLSSLNVVLKGLLRKDPNARPSAKEVETGCSAFTVRERMETDQVLPEIVFAKPSQAFMKRVTAFVHLRPQ